MVREVQEAYLKNRARTLASHPTGHTVLPKALYVHTQVEKRRVFSPTNMKLYLLSLASPDHPRFKADRLSRPIFGRWLSLRPDCHRNLT